MDINIFNKIYTSLINSNKNMVSYLEKIKSILANETKESHEMLKIYQKYVLNNEDITKEELDKAFSSMEKVYYLDECMFTIQTFRSVEYAPKL